jgi:hypothetical protein
MFLFVSVALVQNTLLLSSRMRDVTITFFRVPKGG